METQFDEHSESPQPRPSVPWQYSLRALFVLMAVTSICLAIGVQFAGVMAALLVFGLIQAALLLAADWLIRPANRRWLALVTATSWTIVGSALFILGTRQVSQLSGGGDKRLAWTGATALIAVGALCYLVAIRRWRQLTSD